MPLHNISRSIAAPQIVRKNRIISIPKPVRHPIRQTIISKLLKQPERDISKRLVAKQQIVNQVVSKPRSLKRRESRRKNGEPRLITPDLSGIDLERIKSIRGLGHGRILVIIGNGPSLLEIDPEPLRNHSKIDIMSVNKPDSRLWPTKFWVFFDSSQQRRHSALIDSYNGIIFNSSSIRKMRPNTVQLKNLGKRDFSLDLLKGFNIGRSSTYAAMQIGLWMSFSYIYILGCDMTEVNGKLHFYGINPDVKPDDRKKRFDPEATYYDHAASILPDDIRQKFIFCSNYNPYQFVDKFGRLDHNVAIQEILSRAEVLKNGKTEES